MSPDDPSVTHAEVVTAERAGSGRPSQDRIFTTSNTVIVLDGASHPTPTARDGGWIAEQIGRELRSRLATDPEADLQLAVAGAIAAVADTHKLRAGESPSTTVSIARWTEDTLDVLVLCDSPVIVIDRSDTVHEIRDDRLRTVNDQLDRPAGFADNRSAWHRFLTQQREYRNVPGGYWVAEADPTAARHAVTATWPIADVAAVLAVTDGVSRGPDTYGVPDGWLEVYRLAAQDPAAAIDAVHDAERSDPDGHRWPRSKRHDDKALAMVRFTRNAAH